MKLHTPLTMAGSMNAHLSALAAAHGCSVDPVVMHHGTLMAHTHITWHGRRGHLQFPLDPIGMFDEHIIANRIEDKFKQVLALMQTEAA